MTEKVFSERIFPRYEPESVVKKQMEAFSDPTIPNFSLLNLSCFAKEYFKDDSFEKEYIKSFLQAVKVLAREGRKDTNRPEGQFFFNYSYALPVLYMTRHCMELTQKRAIRRKGGNPAATHDLKRLWEDFLSMVPAERTVEDHQAIENMGLFVKALSDIDGTGFDLRYPKDKKGGQYTQDRPLFIDNEQTACYLNSFVKQLELVCV